MKLSLLINRLPRKRPAISLNSRWKLQTLSLCPPATITKYSNALIIATVSTMKIVVHLNPSTRRRRRQSCARHGPVANTAPSVTSAHSLTVRISSSKRHMSRSNSAWPSASLTLSKASANMEPAANSSTLRETSLTSISRRPAIRICLTKMPLLCSRGWSRSRTRTLAPLTSQCPPRADFLFSPTSFPPRLKK